MRIPVISDDRLAELIAKIKPVKTEDRLTLREISVHPARDPEPKRLLWYNVPEPHNPRKHSYIWSAVEGEEAIGLRRMRFEEYSILVSWGYYGFFKPSLAEVFSQTPERLIDSMVAFEIHGPDTRPDMFDGTWTQRVLNEGFQLALITPYERAAK